VHRQAAHLGSSIGVGKANDVGEVRALLPANLSARPPGRDRAFVPHLAEYNVAVARIGGTVRTSAIEKPKRAEELLDFPPEIPVGRRRQGRHQGRCAKQSGDAVADREINPALLPAWKKSCGAGQSPPSRRWAAPARRGSILLQRGNRRDLAQRGQPVPGLVWLFPVGSGEPPIGFTQLLSMLIDEALTRHRECQLPDDPVTAGSAPAAAVVACTRFINALERDSRPVLPEAVEKRAMGGG